MCSRNPPLMTRKSSSTVSFAKHPARCRTADGHHEWRSRSRWESSHGCVLGPPQPPAGSAAARGAKVSPRAPEPGSPGRLGLRPDFWPAMLQTELCSQDNGRGCCCGCRACSCCVWLRMRCVGCCSKACVGKQHIGRPTVCLGTGVSPGAQRLEDLRVHIRQRVLGPRASD